MERFAGVPTTKSPAVQAVCLLAVLYAAAACSSDESGATNTDGGGAAPGAGGSSNGGSANGGANGNGGSQAGSGGAAGRTGGNGGASGNGGSSSGGANAGGSSGQSSGGGSSTGGAVGTGPLPEGNNGIAAKHPGDVGIGSDPDVIFADDFEGYSQGSDLNNRWDAVYQNQYVTITTTAANVYGGSKALEFTLPMQTAELSDGTDKLVNPERDVLYLRYYSKFMPPYDVVGSSHNGSSISAHYFNGNMATPGIPANGTNKFLVNYENWRGDAQTASPGLLNVYVYHPLQRDVYGDHFFPTGLVMPNTSLPFDFGPNFVARPDVIPELDRWYCYEYMVQANTPNQKDGRIAFWLDGALKADFGNLRLRDVDTLKIDRFGLSFHIKSNPNQEAKKWYDDVVAATSYIGPKTP